MMQKVGKINKNMVEKVKNVTYTNDIKNIKTGRFK